MTEPHRSTARVIAALQLVGANSRPGLTLSELANELRVPKSSLLPLLHTLRDANFLALDDETQRYRIGFELVALGQAYLEANSASADIRAIMEEIVEQCGETCYFGYLSGSEVVYQLAVESPQPIRMVASVGKRLPAHSTAIGKALLSDKSRAALQALYPNGLTSVTPNTITSIAALMAQLTQTAETDLAFESEESTPHICCVAVPLRADGHVRAAASVATPVFRFTREKKAAVIELLQRAQPRLERIVSATEIGRAPGGGGSAK